MDGALLERLTLLEQRVRESEQRAKASERKVKVVSEALEASSKHIAALALLVDEQHEAASCFLVNAGKILANLGWPVFILQSNIWILAGVAVGSASRPHENSDGTYNMSRAAARTVPCLGCFFNSLVFAWWIVITYDDMESKAVAYVTWWFFVTALVIVDYYHTWCAGTDWRKAMNQFSAGLFLFFGAKVGEVACADNPEVSTVDVRLQNNVVPPSTLSFPSSLKTLPQQSTEEQSVSQKMVSKSKTARNSIVRNSFFAGGAAAEYSPDATQVTGGETAFTLYIMAALLPAALTGFLYHWFSEPQYDLECNKEWTPDHTAFCGDGVCCLVEDERTDYFIFVAFFSGNVLAGYQVVKYCATALLAYGEAVGEMVGGTVVNNADRDVLKSAMRAHSVGSKQEDKSSGTGLCRESFFNGINPMTVTKFNEVGDARPS